MYYPILGSWLCKALKEKHRTIHSELLWSCDWRATTYWCVFVSTRMFQFVRSLPRNVPLTFLSSSAAAHSNPLWLSDRCYITSCLPLPAMWPNVSSQVKVAEQTTCQQLVRCPVIFAAGDFFEALLFVYEYMCNVMADMFFLWQIVQEREPDVICTFI